MVTFSKRSGNDRRALFDTIDDRSRQDIEQECLGTVLLGAQLVEQPLFF